MNYNHDTDQDLDFAASQLRKKQNAHSILEDAPIRRITSALAQSGARIVDPGVTPDATLGTALSALDIHGHSEDDCQRIFESILEVMSDRRRLELHKELVQLKGLQHILGAIRRHGDACTIVALRLLDKLSRTSARDITAAGGVEVLLERSDMKRESPRVVEAVVRVLLGLTFESDAKVLLLRRGVRGLAESIVELIPDTSDAELREAQADLKSVGTRLLNRLSDGEKGYRNRFEAPGQPKIVLS